MSLLLQNTSTVIVSQNGVWLTVSVMHRTSQRKRASDSTEFIHLYLLKWHVDLPGHIQVPFSFLRSRTN